MADTNVANEAGHTFYPKLVDSKEKDEVTGKPKRVRVENAKEEEEVTGKKPGKPGEKAANWTA